MSTLRGSKATWPRLVAGLLLVGALLVTDGPAGADDGTEGDTVVWRQVDAGENHTCAIRTTGRLYCWGRDEYGQLGDGGANTNQSVPVEVAGGRTDWASVSAGGFHTCARRTTGRLFCWGRDFYGQLGNGGANADRTVPTQVAGGRTDWTSIVVGRQHSCARRADGRLFCWGDDTSLQLGDGAGAGDRAVPTQVAGGRTDWSSVAAGTDHTCARRTSGRLFCWGGDDFGQVGDGGGLVNRAVPTQVAGGRTDWTSVAAGYSHTCARRTSGRLFCWGNDGSGQVGDGSSFGGLAPVQVTGGRTDWAVVAAGGYHTCARRDSRRLFCWGYDSDGQQGNGGANDDNLAPVEVDGARTDWAGVSLGLYHSCALRTDGSLYCWGEDFFGSLGDGGANADKNVPVAVFV